MVISKMDEYVHKIKPPNFGGFFVASDRIQQIRVACGSSETD